MTQTAFPFSAIVAQDDMKLALQLAAVDNALGGVLVFGDRGTGKTTAMRALAALLPEQSVRANCPYGCEPSNSNRQCENCANAGSDSTNVETTTRTMPVVDLPLGVTEDRVVGALDIEKALTDGVKTFQPGLLAAANRGFLYIDEVNLLEDHIVDLLLDVAASGVNVVERDGLSIRHPARFLLVGSGNPEEGELRPQLQDRFGLSVTVRTPGNIEARMNIVRSRDEFERNPGDFAKKFADQDAQVQAQIVAATARLQHIDTPEDALRQLSTLCVQLGTDGLRGELTLLKASRAYAALCGDDAVSNTHIARVAPMALAHRLRRDPLDDSASDTRVIRAMTSVGLAA